MSISSEGVHYSVKVRASLSPDPQVGCLNDLREEVCESCGRVVDDTHDRQRGPRGLSGIDRDPTVSRLGAFKDREMMLWRRLAEIPSRPPVADSQRVSSRTPLSIGKSWNVKVGGPKGTD